MGLRTVAAGRNGRRVPGGGPCLVQAGRAARPEGGPEDVRDVQEIMASGKWELERIITPEFPLNELEQAIRTASDVDHAGNVVVEMKG